MVHLELDQMPIALGKAIGMQPNSVASLQQSANDFKTLLFKSDAEIARYYQNYNAENVARQEVNTVYNLIDDDAVKSEQKEQHKAAMKTEKMKQKACKAQASLGDTGKSDSSDRQGTILDDFQL